METVTYTQTSLPLHFFYRRYETDFQGMLALVRVVAGELYEAAVAAGLAYTGYHREQYLQYDFTNSSQNLTRILLGVAKA